MDTTILLHAGGGIAMTMAGVGALKFFLSAGDSVRRIPQALDRTADAIDRIASRDQELAREQDLVLGHLARNSEEILSRLDKIESRLKT